MGRIKKTIIPKPDRATVASEPPSMRRMKREFAQGKIITLKDGTTTYKRLRRKQYIPPTLLLKLNKKSQYHETVVHETGSVTKKAKTSSRKVTQLTAPLSSVQAKRLLNMAQAKQGKTRVIKGRTIYHDLGVTL